MSNVRQNENDSQVIPFMSERRTWLESFILDPSAKVCCPPDDSFECSRSRH